MKLSAERQRLTKYESETRNQNTTQKGKRNMQNQDTQKQTFNQEIENVLNSQDYLGLDLEAELQERLKKPITTKVLNKLIKVWTKEVLNRVGSGVVSWVTEDTCVLLLKLIKLQEKR